MFESFIPEIYDVKQISILGEEETVLILEDTISEFISKYEGLSIIKTRYLDNQGDFELYLQIQCDDLEDFTRIENFMYDVVRSNEVLVRW